jgi:hypothetical protein
LAGRFLGQTPKEADESAEFMTLLKPPKGEHAPADMFKRTPTSVTGMSPGNPWLLALASMPVAEGVHTHSIIPVKGDGDPHHGQDGVVAYTSAHIEPVDSELIVRSKHSCMTKPKVVEEVRRILLKHLDSLPASMPKQLSTVK